MLDTSLHRTANTDVTSPQPSSGKASMEAVVGRNIRGMRHVRSLTLEEVAIACGLSKGQMSKIENGHISPPLSTIERIAKALEVDPGSLLRRRESSDWHVIRGAELDVRRRKLKGADNHYEALFPDSTIDSTYQPMHGRLSKSSHLKFFRYPGAVFMAIVGGAVEYEYGGETIPLEAGDIFYCDGRKEHGPVRILSGPVDYLLILGALRG
jgi:transcriptional regulator with XRE-family HTH domain